MYQRFIENGVLANLVFVLVLAIGAASYFSMPREQDPTINFNWIEISTILPGASAQDVEKLVTAPLEDAIKNISDTKFVSSVSRESGSRILARFEEIDERTFDKRLADLRREIQSRRTAATRRSGDAGDHRNHHFQCLSNGDCGGGWRCRG